MTSTTLMVLMSWTSSIDVTFISNRLGKYLNIFMTSFYLDIFSLNEKEVLEMSHGLMLKSDMDSSYFILRFSNFIVRSYNLYIRTLDVPSYAILRTSHASLASLHGLINLNMLLSTQLKITFKALEFSRASSSSTLDQSALGFKIDVQSLEVVTRCFKPFITASRVLLSMDLRKVTILNFQ